MGGTSQCTNAVREDGLYYQIKLTDKFVSNPKSLFRYSTSLRQAKTKFSQSLGLTGPNNDGDVNELLE